MIPQPFDYYAPATLREALAMIAGGEHKILAGGMSLVPLMKLRLAQPEHVVDLGRIPELNYIAESGGVLRIGAMSTHHDIESSAAVRAHCPLLAEAAGHIGDAQVRNMGTIGGSIAHADPSADYPAALLALETKIRIVSANLRPHHRRGGILRGCLHHRAGTGRNRAGIAGSRGRPGRRVLL